MIPTLRQIKGRIRSVENTWKVTRAMEMVSVVKLRRVESLLLSQRGYFERLDRLVKDLLIGQEQILHPFFEKREEKSKAALYLLTSDTGLCGLYNDSIINEAESFIRSYGPQKIKLIAIGKKGFNYFKRKGIVETLPFEELHGRFSPEILERMVNDMTLSFLTRQVDEVYVVYMRFGSLARYRPHLEKFLNMEFSPGCQEKFIVEPSVARVLEVLMPAYIYHKMRLFLLESFTCEHSARTMAMHAATDNAKDLMEGLILLRNKVRQAGITKEVVEIISASEALKG